MHILVKQRPVAREWPLYACFWLASKCVDLARRSARKIAHRIISMADFRAAIYSIDEGGGGSINWQPLMQVTSTVARLHCLPGDLLAALSDRLKSEATYVVLNTLTVSIEFNYQLRFLTCIRNRCNAGQAHGHHQSCQLRQVQSCQQMVLVRLPCQLFVLHCCRLAVCTHLHPLLLHTCRPYTPSVSTASRLCTISCSAASA